MTRYRVIPDQRDRFLALVSGIAISVVSSCRVQSNPAQDRLRIAGELRPNRAHGYDFTSAFNLTCPATDFHDVLDVAALLLLLQILRLLPHEFLEARLRQACGLFTGSASSPDKRMNKRSTFSVSFSGSAQTTRNAIGGASAATTGRIGGASITEPHGKQAPPLSAATAGCSSECAFARSASMAFAAAPKCRCDRPSSFSCTLFAENILVLRVGLREVVQPKPLPEFQLAGAFAVALDDLLDAPLNFRRRTLPPSTEILIVLNLQAGGYRAPVEPSSSSIVAIRRTGSSSHPC